MPEIKSKERNSNDVPQQQQPRIFAFGRIHQVERHSRFVRSRPSADRAELRGIHKGAHGVGRVPNDQGKVGEHGAI